MIKYKKATQIQQDTFNTVRILGIRLGILARSFPKKIRLSIIDEPKLHWAAIGGAKDETGKDRFFITLNLAGVHNMQYMLALYAHEILHVNQNFTRSEVNHGNKFRSDCKKFAKALGASYYLIYGYDAPSENTANILGRKHAAWLKTFGDAEHQKTKLKASQECDEA